MQIQENASLRHLNTFHVSAHCRYFCRVTSIAELQEVISWIHANPMPYLLIGQGSNILFRADYPGLIIELQLRGIDVITETEQSKAERSANGADDTVLVRAAAGEPWHEFVLYTLQLGYFGLENLSLIPGTVGSAPVQNIGAYGAEVKDHLVALEAMEIATGEMRHFSNSECEFTYRNSVFKSTLRNQFIICSVTFRLSRTAQLNIAYPALQQALANIPKAELGPQQVSDAVCQIRRSKLPDHAVIGNAGSFFFNPTVSTEDFARLQSEFPAMPGFPSESGVKIPAAWLIEQAGWKGYRSGDVGVHTEHALVLVNYGQGSGAQLVELSETIQASVEDRFGIALWPEVRIV